MCLLPPYARLPHFFLSKLLSAREGDDGRAGGRTDGLAGLDDLSAPQALVYVAAEGRACSAVKIVG